MISGAMGLLILRPVPVATPENTVSHFDYVEYVFEGPSSDIVFNLKDRQGYPYINRGLQRGLDLDVLKQELTNKYIEMKFVKHWTPLDFKQSNPTVAYIKIVEDDRVIYNAIQN